MIEKVYDRLVMRNREVEQELRSPARENVVRNGLRLVTATALQSSGDQTVNASTVLPWLFHALGVPSALNGVLVPIRESGSMLPQALLTPLVLRVAHRRWIFVVGALVQALAVAVMAGTAAIGRGLGAGLVIVAALTVFSVGRSLSSIASKDVQGRTVPKGERGQITGLATTASGLVAITLGLGIRIFGGGDLAATQLAWLLAAGAVLWLAAAWIYSGIREPGGEHPPETGSPAAKDPADRSERGWWSEIWGMLRHDAPFRRFVVARSLLLVSSLSPPFVVTLSVSSGAGGLGGLGGFVLASGIASLLGGRIFGREADRSSRRLMMFGAAVASAVVALVAVVVSLPGFDGATWWGTVVFLAGYFGITLMHTGVRVGRKTYVVDLAVGDQRTEYVAVSNSAMGVILLVVGGISSLLAIAGTVWALVFLAALGAVGVVAAARLPEVSQG